MIADRDDHAETDDRNPVDMLADEFSERLRAGENPSITEYVRRRPDLEDDIRELFPTITMMEQFRKKQQTDTQLEQVSARLDAERLKKLGDFRIIREIGRGGMGVVYDAEQQSLKRHVALKVLAPGITGSENELRRFKREAEAAARLHHTNIVPVFGTGESDGLHFIVMQLVDGVPLNEAIDSVRIDSKSTVQPAATEADSSHDGEEDEATLSSGSFTAQMAASALLTGSTLQPTAASIAASLKSGAATGDPAAAPSTKSFYGHAGSDSGGSFRIDYEKAADAAPAESGPAESGPPEPLPRNLGRRYWNSVADIAAEIGDAISYAHDQGIVHRDVKPSNILFDRAGGVWITDFGLARHEEHEAVTRSGDIIGTLRYMAPEQCDGTGDTRSDIYSLGLTLYELITLQPAFPEARHGVLIQQKQDGDFPKPRSINPRIPRDLETITLKACSTDPAHRYQTAAALAADLRRFLDDRPVRARRITSAERLWRWSRRNPVTASLSGLSLVLLIAVAVVVSIGNYKTGLALADAQNARKTAEGERTLAEIERNRAVAAAGKAREEEERARIEGERAEANLQIAVRAFEEIIGNIASRGIPQSMTFASAEAGEEGSSDPPATSSDSVVTQADADLLESLLRFFDEFADRNSADLQLQSALARQKIGDIHQRLGHSDEAVAAYREALGIVAALSEKDPADSSLILQQARILNDLGVTLSRGGQFREPYELHQRARTLISESEELMATTEGRFALAQTHNLAGSIGSRTGFTSLYAALSSDGSFRRRPNRPRSETTSGTSPRPDRTPAESTSQQTGEAGTGTSNTGPGTSNTGPDGQSGSQPSAEDRARRARAWRSQITRILDSYDQAITLLTDLIEQEPSSGRFRLALARCFRNRMAFARMIRRRSLERESLDEAIRYLDALTTDFPNVPVYQFELADTLCLNVVRSPGERDADYEARVRRAIATCRNLTAAYPTFAEYRALTATSLARLAAIHRAGGNIDAARDAYVESLALQRDLTTEYESVSSYHILYVHTLISAADLEDTDGTREAATTFRRVAIEHLTRQLAAGEKRLFRLLLERLERRLKRDDPESSATPRTETGDG